MYEKHFSLPSTVMSMDYQLLVLLFLLLFSCSSCFHQYRLVLATAPSASSPLPLSSLSVTTSGSSHTDKLFVGGKKKELKSVLLKTHEA